METQFSSASLSPRSPTASVSFSPTHYPGEPTMPYQALTAAVKEFIIGSFAGANLLEEHQVCSPCLTGLISHPYRWPYGEACTGIIVVKSHCVHYLKCYFELANFNCAHVNTQTSVTFQIRSEVSWSYIFKCIETNKHRLKIVDYSVSQTTLDQVGTTRVLLRTTNSYLVIYAYRSMPNSFIYKFTHAAAFMYWVCLVLPQKNQAVTECYALKSMIETTFLCSKNLYVSLLY